MSALDLYQKEPWQAQLAVFLKSRQVPPSLIARIKTSLPFGEDLKNAMVLLGQRPASREPVPEIAAEYSVIVHRDLRRAVCVRAVIDWVRCAFAEHKDALAGSR